MGMGVGGGERGVWELLCGVLCKKDRIRFIGHFRAELLGGSKLHFGECS